MSEVLSLDEARARRRASAPASSLGPYETAYDVRRGYDGPAPRPRLRRADEDEVFLFLARDDEDERR